MSESEFTPPKFRASGRMNYVARIEGPPDAPRLVIEHDGGGKGFVLTGGAWIGDLLELFGFRDEAKEFREYIRPGLS